ncbi:hypothetical protein CORC01_14045 [Colletotrichum orchidophilum]|uniref:Uncharacterized protein n=1 Tax=Colletotrichum orchidophilum TaxID=1209926 RepID=A0A1G4ANH8_9PEZI|nr:uncharacterized protein CORC01_14045 [Colletotrichum orchidophilum]OHE90656.1 hypothetical protein CORC01_14045 [Colletotrichum orchidophilum]
MRTRQSVSTSHRVRAIGRPSMYCNPGPWAMLLTCVQRLDDDSTETPQSQEYADLDNRKMAI